MLPKELNMISCRSGHDAPKAIKLGTIRSDTPTHPRPLLYLHAFAVVYFLEDVFGIAKTFLYRALDSYQNKFGLGPTLPVLKSILARLRSSLGRKLV